MAGEFMNEMQTHHYRQVMFWSDWFETGSIQSFGAAYNEFIEDYEHYTETDVFDDVEAFIENLEAFLCDIVHDYEFIEASAYQKIDCLVYVMMNQLGPTKHGEA